MTREDHHHEEEIEELAEQSPFVPPRIYEGEWLELIPKGFDTVTISLDGRMQSDLNWSKGKEQGLQAIENGYAVMWNMNMGFFHELMYPLSHQGQFLSLTLALEHFRDSIWKGYKEQTLGLTLFQGSADFSRGFRWDELQEQNLHKWFHEIELPHLATLNFTQIEQHQEGSQLMPLFCRDVAIEYLALLRSHLPDGLSVYLFLDTTHLSPHSPLTEIQMLNPERYDRMHLALRGNQLPFHTVGWGAPTAYGYSGASSVDLPDMQIPSVGICIPPLHYYRSQYYKGFEEALLALQQNSIPFKLIAESHLTAQWDGLDDLLYCPAGLTLQGKRKLQGFCAAGGTVVSTDHLMGLSNEIGLKEWLQFQTS